MSGLSAEDREALCICPYAHDVGDDVQNAVLIEGCDRYLDEVLAPFVAARVNAALTAAADEIVAELVCCDAYERGDHKTRDQICYWGGASASLVRSHIT